MSGLTPGGWPFAVDDDFAIEWPAVSEALAVKLDAAAARSSGSSVRASSASTGAGVFAPFAAAVSLPAAPAGLYLIALTGSMQRQGEVGTALQSRIEANAVVLRLANFAEVTDDFTRAVAVTVLHPHAGGALTVNASGTAVGASSLIHTGSRIDVARISI